MAQLRRDDPELERALGTHRSDDRTRAVAFGLLGFVAVLSLAAALYPYGR